MPYEILDKTAPFSLAFGIVNLHGGNSKLVRTKSEIAGSDIQRTAQFALLMGVQHAVRKITYDGADIPAENYQFYKGAPGQIAALSPDGNSQSFFPNNVNHWKDNSKPSTSFINIRYPVSMSIDGQPEKTVIQLDSTETKRYDANGSVVDFGYSTNPARFVAYAVEMITGRTDIIDFGALHEYEAWCDELITVKKNGVDIQVPRFRLDAFFTPPFNTKQLLDRVCQLTCSDFQERPKITLIPPKTGAVDFVFDHDNNLSADLNDFEFEPVNAKAKFNGVIASWRDLDDPLKGEAEPIIIDRRANPFIPKKFYQLNLGGAWRDQAERVANFNAKVQCDLADFAAIRADYSAYPVLPCDIGTVKHPVPGWDGARVKVLKKKEKEDRSSVTGVEQGAGYQLFVRREPELYSDTDFSPVTTRTQLPGVNPYAAPPTPTLSFSQPPGTITGRNGTVERPLTITVQFQPFAGRQRARLLWAKPGEPFKYLDDVSPEANNCVVPNPPPGDNYFRVRAYNADYYTQSTPDDFLFSVGSINTDILTPVITKIGVSTLSTVSVGISFSERTRYRKIQKSNNEAFVHNPALNLFVTTLPVIDLRNPPVSFPGIHTFTKTYSDIPFAEWVRVAQSSNNIEFSDYSQPFLIEYKNELENGVPVLFNPAPNPDEPMPAKAASVGDLWVIDVQPPKKNGANATNVQIRFLENNPAKFTRTSGGHAANASEILVLDVSHFSSSGGKAHLEYGETISYTGVSTAGGNKLIGVTRGVDGSTAQPVPENTIVRQIYNEKSAGYQLSFTVPRLPDAYLLQVRWRNTYYESGQQGWSLWGAGGEAVGYNFDPNPAPFMPEPAPAAPEQLPPGAEDPFNPANDKGYYERTPWLMSKQNPVV